MTVEMAETKTGGKNQETETKIENGSKCYFFQFITFLLIRKRSRERRRSRDRDREREEKKRKEEKEQREKREREDRERQRQLEEEERRRKEELRLAEEEAELCERDKRTVFVYHLHPKVDSKMLTEFFAKAGKVRDVRLITDKKTGKSKGYARFHK